MAESWVILGSFAPSNAPALPFRRTHQARRSDFRAAPEPRAESKASARGGGSGAARYAGFSLAILPREFH